MRLVSGRPALSIDWGLWEGSGMLAALADTDRARLFRRGIRPMRPDDALALLGAAMAGRAPQLLIGAFARPDDQNDVGAWRARVAAACESDRAALVTDCLRACAAEVLGMRPEAISAADNLLALGADSLMVMDMAKLLKRALGCTLYPRELYQRPVVAELAAYLVKEIAVQSRPDDDATPEGPLERPVEWASAVFANGHRASGAPVPDIGFILSAPRSGSTLLRVMLAGHPRLFVPPELHLLPFAGMAARAAQLAGSHLDEGLTRALMELDGVGGIDARTMTAALVAEDVSVQDVYRLLRAKAAGRLVIDKSPSYAADMETLRRADIVCDAPRFVHVVRHPLAMMDSFARQRLDRLIGAATDDPLTMAETIWRVMNSNIRTLAAEVGDDRCLVLRYEDLVTHPEDQSRRLCTFLGVPYDSALLDPYGGERMTDGVSERSLPVGDPNFAVRRAIDPDLAEAWREVVLPRGLAEETAALAREFGYETATVRKIGKPTTFGSPGVMPMREEIVPGCGGELAVCHWGDPASPAVVCVHGILEQGAVFGPLARFLVAAGYRVIAPDLRGHGKSTHNARGRLYQITDFVADLDAVVSHAACGPVVLLGASLGAAVASVFAAARPETVTRLVLVEPPVRRGDEPAEALAMLRAQLSSSGDAPADRAMPDLAAAAKRLIRVVPTLDESTARHLAERGTERRADGLHWRWDRRLRSPAGVGVASGLGDPLRYLTTGYTLVFGRDGDLHGARDWRALCNEYLSGIIELPGGHNLHFDVPEALSRIVTA
jgi:pimeloyl-ACP methyl ester carboxylesterase/aryl carrier-like protein